MHFQPPGVFFGVYDLDMFNLFGLPETRVKRRGDFVYDVRGALFSKTGITEGELSANPNRKYVWFFAYNLRMERGKVLILAWLSAHCQYL